MSTFDRHGTQKRRKVDTSAKKPVQPRNVIALSDAESSDEREYTFKEPSRKTASPKKASPKKSPRKPSSHKAASSKKSSRKSSSHKAASPRKPGSPKVKQLYQKPLSPRSRQARMEQEARDKISRARALIKQNEAKAKLQRSQTQDSAIGGGEILSQKDQGQQRTQQLLAKNLEKAVEDFDYTAEEYEILENYICKKLRGLTEPVAELADASKAVRAKVEHAVTRRVNLCCVVRGGIKSGKTLMISHALSQLDGIVPVNVCGRDSETQVLQQIANVLNPCATNRLETFTDLKNWFLSVIQKQAAKKKTIVLVVDHFERFCNRSKQQLLYTLLDGMHQKAFRLIIIGTTADSDITSNLERRIKSRAEFVPISVSKNVNLIKVLMAHLLLGDDAPAKLRGGFKDAYNKIARLRIRSLLSGHPDAMMLQMNGAGNAPLVQSLINFCFPITKLIDGNFHIPTPGDLCELSHSALLICVALAKLHERRPSGGAMTFESILWELRGLWQQPSYVDPVKDPLLLLGEFRQLISRGVIVRAPVISNRWLIPDEPVKISLAPVTLAPLRVINNYISQLKRVSCADAENPLANLPSIVVAWCKKS